MKAILYARYSPGKNKEKQSGNDQFMVMREYCEKDNIEIGGEFIDESITGKDADRPALWEAIESLNRGDILLARSMCRLARETMLAIHLEIIVKKKGASIRTIDGTDSSDDTPEATFMRRIMQAVNELERATISARTSAAMRLRLKRGLVVGGQQPYGWMRDPDDDGKLIECKAEQDMIGCIFAMHDQSYGANSIAHVLNGLEHTKRNGSPWDRTTIARIIKRESA